MGLAGATASQRLVWKGKDADTRLFTAFAQAGAKWQDQGRAGADRASDHGPGLATVQGLEGFVGLDVLMAWRGPEDDTRLISSSHGLGGWTGQKAIGDEFRSSDGPALSRIGRHVLMAWKAADSSELLWSRFDGAQWLAPEPLAGGSSSHSPAILGVGDQAVAAWKGQPGDSRVFFSMFDGRRWASQQSADGGAFGTADRPGLGFLGRVVMAWRGKDEDRRLFFSRLSGGRWDPQEPINGGAFGSEHGPALCPVESRLLMVWRGTGPDPRMFQSFFDGRTWSGQEDVLQQRAGTSHTPALASFVLIHP
jgi:hypothetical protein